VEKIEELKYPKEYFDVIVFADVLEHLRQPDKVLLNLRKYLRADGFMVASLPNIARIDIRLKLILGRFDYGDSGILDKTHLKFFTLSSAKKLFTENGFMIERIDYSGRAARFRIMPTCFAFQFIILAKKNKE
jgi:2-polyprenyl-3-methyl-5-hydroxy-6-metoxy-1,4-benzoquinol methylase